MEGVEPFTLVIAATAALGMLTLVLGLAVATDGDARRIRRRRERARQRGARGGNAVEELAKLRRERNDGMQGLEALAVRLMPHPALLRERLRRTGREISLGQYVAICLAVAAAAFVALMILLELPVAAKLLAAAAVGAGLPHLAVGVLVSAREKKFLAEFPDAIDLIIRGLRSGLPVPESIRSVGAEFDGPVGAEFKAMADRLKIGQTLDEALNEAARRIGLPDFGFFVISIAVQRETGGNLAETLENLSDILRKRRQMVLKVKAMSSEAKASAMILGSLPFVMFAIMMVINQGYVMELFEDMRGHLLVGGGLLFLATGVGVMMKMVRFEI